MRKKILVVGATGIVGHTALEHFAASGDWDAVAVSRRKPECNSAFEHAAIDLTDEKRCREAFGSMSDITHVVYTALQDRPPATGQWPSKDSLQGNLAMLRNLLEPLTAAAKNLRHVTILQGTKAYGVHVGNRIAIPAKERWPRFEHENFYWLQEDYIKDLQTGSSWSWTIFRPQIIFGYAIGSPMNFIPVLGVLGAVCREENRPMGFPGESSSILEATDARVLARAFEWAATASESRNATFNITNGDVFVWRNVWPAIADALGVEPGPDDSVSLQDLFQENAACWTRVVEKYGLRNLTLEQLIGQSDAHADISFRYGTDPKSSALVSTIKLRQNGFGDCLDTEDSFRFWFDQYAERGILPKLP